MQQTISDDNLAPTNPKESALLATLDPAGYTVSSAAWEV